MDILKIATEWARAEVFSSKFFIFFGILFVLGTIGFWQLGKTETAKAFIYPTLVSGILLLAVGIGILYANSTRVSSFATAYNEDATAFVKSEISRTEQSIGEYRTIVFKVIPVIIMVMSLILIFVDKPIWRAICATTIAMMVVIILVDTNANARLLEYRQHLEKVDKYD